MNGSKRDRPTDRPTEHEACRPTVGSLFSGIGGFDLGFQDAGFDVTWQVEIEPDAIAVLHKHWPAVRRFRDINAVVYGQHRHRIAHGLVLDPVDVIVGGFPCQDLSVAGQRRGLSGSRSGLFFAFMRAIRLMRARFGKPDYVVIENVPGLLTSERGRDFHTVLSALADIGFRRAYRVLDSRYFGVAQRRRRVFIVGSGGDTGDRARTILFESAGRNRHPAAGGAAGARVAASLRGRSSRRGVNAPGRGGEDDVNLIPFDTTQLTSAENRSNPQAGDPCHSLSADAHVPSVAFTITSVHRGVGQGHNTTYLPIAGPLGGGNDGIGRRSEDDPNLVFATLNSSGNDGGFRTEPGEHLVVSSSGERARALTASCYKHHDDDTDTLIASPITASAGHHGHSSPRGDGRDNLVYSIGSHAGSNGPVTNSQHEGGGAVGFGINEDESNTLRAGHVNRIGGAAVGVRRLTPLECERLQGFPDGWTCLCGVMPYSTVACTCPDTPRYKGLGNAVTATVARWIGRNLRTAMMEMTA